MIKVKIWIRSDRSLQQIKWGKLMEQDEGKKPFN